MKHFLEIVRKIDSSFQVLACLMLVLMLLMTVIDVTLRFFGKPFFGTIEIICFCGAALIGFGLPHASWNHVHIIVDVIVAKLPRGPQMALQCVTKGAGGLFFAFVGYNFFLYGLELTTTGEVSGALKIPYSPVMYALGFSCFLQALTLLCDIPRSIIGEEQ